MERTKKKNKIQKKKKQQQQEEQEVPTMQAAAHSFNNNISMPAYLANKRQSALNVNIAIG